MKSEIDELVYEWVDIEEVNTAPADSKSSCDEDVVDQDYGDEVDQRDGDRPPFAPTGGDTRPDFIPAGVVTD